LRIADCRLPIESSLGQPNTCLQIRNLQSAIRNRNGLQALK
jgi:hypothetical protein